MKRAEKLYIIGNGFDKAHSLQCDYSDFRDYLDVYEWQFLMNFEKMFGIEPIDASDPYISTEDIDNINNYIYSYLWKHFEEKLGEMDDQEMLDFSDSIVDSLCLETGPINIVDTMNNYWEEEYKFIKKLQFFLKEWVKTIDTSNIEPVCESIIESKDYFFTFNYTDILEKTYNIIPSNILHIHGSIGEDDDNLIIGHGNISKINKYKIKANIAKDQFDEGRESIYKALTNCYTRTFKDTKSYISSNGYFFKKLESVKTIAVVGHSFGKVDLPYFKKIKNSVNDDCIWNFYYYTKDDKIALQDYIKKLKLQKSQINILHSNNFFK